MSMQQLTLWGTEVPEHWIECIHFDGRREVVSTLDPSVNWQDMTVRSARFVENPSVTTCNAQVEDC